MKIIIYSLLICFFTSCSIQSRRYRKGFYIESSLNKSIQGNISGNTKSSKIDNGLSIKGALTNKELQNKKYKNDQVVSELPKKKSKEVIKKKIKVRFTSKQQLKETQMNRVKITCKKNSIKQDKSLRKEANFSVIAGSILLLIFWLPIINPSLLFFVLIACMFSLIGCLAAYDVRKDKNSTEEDKVIAKWGRFLSVLPMAIYLAILAYAVISEITNLSLNMGVIKGP